MMKRRRKSRKRIRGFTDRVYLANFICVHTIVIFIILLTAFSGQWGITDMSALAAVPACAYAELGIHSAVIAWKNRCENEIKLKQTFNLDSLTNETGLEFLREDLQ